MPAGLCDLSIQSGCYRDVFLLEGAFGRMIYTQLTAGFRDLTATILFRGVSQA
jgi:hypothetical protein